MLVQNGTHKRLLGTKITEKAQSIYIISELVSQDNDNEGDILEFYSVDKPLKLKIEKIKIRTQIKGNAFLMV